MKRMYGVLNLSLTPLIATCISMSRCPIVMFICVFLFPECSCIYLVLTCNGVISVLYLTFLYKCEVWLATQQGSNHNFFLKMPCTKSGK